MGNAALSRSKREAPIDPKQQAAPASSSSDDHDPDPEGRMAGTATAAGAPWRALIEKSLARNRVLPNARYIQLATVKADGRPANRTVVFRGFLSGSGPAGAAAAQARAAQADALTIVTDARSRKCGECARNPRAEVCWYFPKTREQFRVSGTLEIVGAAGDGDGDGDGDGAGEGQATTAAAAAAAAGSGGSGRRLALLRAVREGAWLRMSDAGREQFFWPHPGQPRLDGDEAAFLAERGAGAEGKGKQPENKGDGDASPPPPPPPPPPVPATFCLGLIEADEVDHVRLTTNRRTRFVLQGDGSWTVEEVNP